MGQRESSVSFAPVVCIHLLTQPLGTAIIHYVCLLPTCPLRLWMCTHICSVLILIIFPKTSTHNKKISTKQWGKRTSTLCELLPATSKICWLIASFAAMLAAIYLKTQVRAETIATMLKQRGKQNHTYYLHENVQTYRNSAVSLYMCREMPLSGVFRRGGKTKQKKQGKQ